MKIGKGKYPSLLFIVILANAMKSTLEVHVFYDKINMDMNPCLEWLLNQF